MTVANRIISESERLTIETIRQSQDIVIKAVKSDGTALVFHPKRTTEKFAHDVAIAVQSQIVEHYREEARKKLDKE